MLGRFPKEEPSILVEAEKIIHNKQFGKGKPQLIRQLIKEYSKASESGSLTTFLLQDSWYRMLASARRYPQVQVRDEISDIRQGIVTLRNDMEAMKQELSSYKQAINELRITKVDKIDVTKLTSVRDLCKSYVDLIGNIDLVIQVFLVESEDVATIWTIIDAPPFEDSRREPIYEAQVKILSIQKGNKPLDFHILNISELSEDVKIESIIPSTGKPVWKR